ncbi:hypothetical protein EDB85DRAFT_1900964 [Lactarius pseudohatsudake]|nr:hypothetical protein EDB85DRAFT_1900964 [Lactarius pseudohatsudake]
MPENSVALFRLGYHSQWLSYAGWFPLLLGLMNTSRRRNKLGLPNWNGAISKRPKTRFDIRSYCHARGRYYYQVSQHAAFAVFEMRGYVAPGVAGSHRRSKHTLNHVSCCALPVPFKNVFCAGISNGLLSPLNPSVDKSLSWHPFLINEDIHGPAVDFAIRKTTNATSVVLALVRASDLTQRHELSDKLKDFLQRAWASELSGSHVALVKTVIDE